MEMTGKRQRELARKVGAAIARRRGLAGLTQEQVSEMLGIGNQAVSRIERGAAMPTLPRLFEFSEAFGCRVDELLLPASDRENDQAAAIAKQIERMRPHDRELVANVVKLLAEHFPKQLLRLIK